VKSKDQYVAKLASDDPFAEDPAGPEETASPVDEPADEDPFASDDEDELGKVSLEEVAEKLDKVLEALGVSEDPEMPEVELGADPAPEPLPEPVADESKGVFASKIAGRKHFTASCRAKADVSDFQIVKDAAAKFPQHSVVSIERDGESVKLLMRSEG
jgi:hypothetical protein